ncbi:MAG TPA: hypothetical protein VE978_11740 [Chitinophagales bacterium]|nr:hypothetical protein [Chitinophagales bacterium]
MKQLLSISLSIFFLFTAAGYYLTFLAADYSAKKEIAQQIQSQENSEQMIQLSFSREELQKEIRFTNSRQNEFIYQGCHYDVVKSFFSGDKISFFCLTDKKETTLFTEFGKQLTEHSSGNNASGKISSKPLMQDWFFQLPTSEVPTETSAPLSSSEVFFLPGIPFKIPSPPPKG